MSNAVLKTPPSMTLTEFLAWPGDGTAKHYELVDGVVHAMSPATATRGLIQARLAYLMTRRLVETGSRCRVMTEGAVVPRLHGNMNLRVPDLGVTCKPITAGQIIVPDPVLLVEILSPSNEGDTRNNVYAFSTIPSVMEILIVHSTRVRIELFRRQDDGSWPEEATVLDAGDTLRLEGIDLTCGVDEVYDGTHLAESA
jgi:Uma2 family endonuclease